MAITYDELMLSLGPVAYWRCDETSTNLFDEVDDEEAVLGGSYTRGADSLLEGDSNYALSLSGSSVARTGTGAKWRLGEEDFAVAMILKYTGTGFSTALSIRIYNGTPLLILVTTSRISTGDVSAETWAWSDANKRVRSSSAINDGNPHHVVVEYVHSTTMLNLYVDGELVDSREQGTGRTTTATAMSLGIGNNWGSNQAFIGVVDEVAAFDKVLGEDNVAALYTIFSEGPQEDGVTLTADASWRVQADRDDQSSWRVATDLEGSSSWRVSDQLLAEVGSRILDEKSASSAWKVLDQTVQDSDWKLLDAFYGELASRILTDVESGAGWRMLDSLSSELASRIATGIDFGAGWTVLDALSRDTAWDILLQGEVLEAVLAYKMFTAMEQQASSGILADMEGASAWKVFGAEENDLAHRILTFEEASTSSRILAATEGNSGWLVLNDHSHECRWAIEALIRQVIASMGWQVFTEMDEDLAWVLLSSCEEFSCNWLIMECLAQRLAWRACGKMATERPVFTCQAKSSQHAFFSR